MKKRITNFLKDENAQALVEYAIIAAILIAASYGMINLFITAWRIKFNQLKNFRAGAAGTLP